MDKIQSLHQLLNVSRRIVIVTHTRPDADALGSSLGLWGYLTQTGHNCTVITPSDYPGFLRWMPGSKMVHVVNRNQPESQIRAEELIREAELIFCLDFSNLKRIDTLELPVRNASGVKVMVDHHLEPETFSDFDFWDVTSAATASLILKLIEDLSGKAYIGKAIANCLYAGLMTDTGGFRHSNTGAHEFNVAARLIQYGAEPSKVASAVYDSNSLNRLQLTGYVLCNKLTVLPEFHTAYMCITRAELDRFKAQTGDTEGLVNYGLSIEGVKLAVLMHDRDGEVKMSLRSTGNFSVNEMSRKHFKGGGHRNAAGGSSSESLEETLKKLISILPEYRDELNKD
jgi:phosphoesterase RecJ-like protein